MPTMQEQNRTEQNNSESHKAWQSAWPHLNGVGLVGQAGEKITGPYPWFQCQTRQERTWTGHHLLRHRRPKVNNNI